MCRNSSWHCTVPHISIFRNISYTFILLVYYTNHVNPTFVSKYIIFLIGNKLDLIDQEGYKREVEEQQALEACQKFGMIWGKEHSTKEIKFEEITNLFKSFVQINN